MFNNKKKGYIMTVNSYTPKIEEEGILLLPTDRPEFTPSPTEVTAIEAMTQLQRISEVVCYDYAFKAYYTTHETKIEQMGLFPKNRRAYGKALFETNSFYNYFDQVYDPAPGNLVVYFSSNRKHVHWGIYNGDFNVSSKWGLGKPREHKIHEVPPEYGFYCEFYKLKNKIPRHLR